MDTLYSACWIDHEKAVELVLTVPDTSDGVYYLFPLMDAWTNIVDSPGWRTTGKEEINVLIQYQHADTLPVNVSDYDLVIESPTSIAYLLGRTNVADQSNLRPTQEQMFSYHLTHDADSSRDKNSKSDHGVGKSNPVDIIFSMTTRDFFNTFADLMITNPPILPQDEAIVNKMQVEYNLIAGEEWDYATLSTTQKEELKTGMAKGINLMYSYPVTRVNGWSMPNMKTGNYSTDYYLRAYIGLVLYAANVPQDAVYYETELLTGGGAVYEIYMSAADIPPTNEFWSITLYSDMGYLVANENQTYSISSQQSLNYGEDGSLHITISMQPPSDVSSTNWLPAPQAGEDFQLTLRVYWPTDVILNSQWTPPVVGKQE